VAEDRTFGRGEALVTQGDVSDGLLVLIEGTAQAWLRDQGGTHHIGSFASGDVVGEMALVTREPRSADVIADSPVRALLVRTTVFDRLAARHLELAIILTELVAQRLGRGAHDGFGGKRVEGYRILECVGRGGMSVVYRARDEATGELVALKMMSYRLIYDSHALSRFRHEASLLQEIEHPHVTRLWRLFRAYNTYFLAMELCDGVDLQRLVNARGPLPERDVRGILGQLASALDYIHRRGLVHRDLKPANVMITRGGDVKLTDFGIAVSTLPLDDAAPTAEQSLLGTPAYMAPEQLSGGSVDRRADVYALGCLAYELLTGKRLFDATRLAALVQEKLTMKLPAASEIAGGITRELHGFIERALRLIPAERPSSLVPLVAWAARCEPPPDALMTGAKGDPPGTSIAERPTGDAE
jgi:eukaryotic-like serine/threonine-protein kinase